jgi:RNA polymerase sigma-70 factor (ECF subfamily)
MTLPLRPRPSPAGAPAQSSPEFDELFLAHYARLCQFAYRITRSRAAAEDIVQDLFLALWSRQGALDLADPLPYLYASVRNRAITHGRRERWRFLTLTSRAADLVSERSPAAEESDLGELTVALERAVQALPGRRRLIFTLHREQHLTYAEIAATLEISIKTVETQMGRALKSLRQWLAPYVALLLAVAGSLCGIPLPSL